MKWATFIFKKIIMPSMDYHVMYWEKKIALDRFLEKYTMTQQVGMGVLVGCTAFLFALPFCASESDRWLLSMATRSRVEASNRELSHRDYCLELHNRKAALLNNILQRTSTIPVPVTAPN
eukprot:TRINITY_DN1327_c0_g1_i1.p1 TRINITY_DN1327_c0_g1~~TRINITY_DN1327_c0_g1_i1.p1  ORF type:complete len:120 (+),score=9.53 TRINITY_DN1327_c0_g1_i1:91-450(+)